MSEDMYTEKHRKFGKTYGRYDGVKPALVTINPELVKSILVKNFDSFHGIMDIPVWCMSDILTLVVKVKWQFLIDMLAADDVAVRERHFLS